MNSENNIEVRNIEPEFLGFTKEEMHDADQLRHLVLNSTNTEGHLKHIREKIIKFVNEKIGNTNGKNIFAKPDSWVQLNCFWVPAKPLTPLPERSMLKLTKHK